MEKLGLLTMHDTINFGSMLQTYALYAAVKSLGKDIVVIDYKCLELMRRENTFSIKDIHSIKDLIKFFLFHKKLVARKKNFRKFINENMEITSEYYKTNIADVNSKFSTFLIGSDIVWGTHITGHDYTYMLDFASDVSRKVAFSPSVGEKWSDEEGEIIKKYLDRFDAISVREKEAAEWTGQLLSRSVDITCDPTMLWDKSFWMKLVSDKYKPSHNYVLVYMSDPEKKAYRDAVTFAKKNNLSVLSIDLGNRILGVESVCPTTIEEWVSLFYYASYVFTGSYHGTLFSIYFNKNFLVYAAVDKSRFNSLMEILDLRQCDGISISSPDQNKIDFESINRKVEKVRKDAWEILRRNLEL